jgi:hypothetical protein
MLGVETTRFSRELPRPEVLLALTTGRQQPESASFQTEYTKLAYTMCLYCEEKGSSQLTERRMTLKKALPSVE